MTNQPTNATADLNAHNVAVERILGDDLSCFNADGTERKERIDKFLRSRNTHYEPHREYYAPQVAAYRAPARPFATDIDLCMTELWPRIVEHIAKTEPRRFDLRLQQTVNAGQYNGFYVEATNSDNWEPETVFTMTERADTAELAICNAFIAVFEGEVAP